MTLKSFLIPFGKYDKKFYIVNDRILAFKKNFQAKHNLYWVVQKPSQKFACIIQPSSRNESARKHVCNGQTS